MAPAFAVIELVVDDAALAGRIVKRAEQAAAAGQPARRDDTPEVFDDRLRAYYKQTAPLLGLLPRQGHLTAVDGMASMDAVTARSRQSSTHDIAWTGQRCAVISACPKRSGSC